MANDSTINVPRTLDSTPDLTRARQNRRRLNRIWAYRFYYLLALPGILYFVIFHYIPMAGIVIAFKDVSPFGGIQGILEAPWVGLRHFERFMQSVFFWDVIQNTLIISGLKILLGFPAPILFALMLNEVFHAPLKRWVQTISYLPHFISWVVVTGLIAALFGTSDGLFTQWLNDVTGREWSFLTSPNSFVWLLVGSHVWKTIGWSSIIYLAAITSIDPHLYEAATIDGANRLQMARHVTIPSIAFVIAILFIFAIGDLLDAGFEQILLLYSPAVYSVSDIIDTYVYREGLLGLNYSFAAAVGLFKSVLSLVLILLANFLARRLGQTGIW
jgi:putative aldouronate transport system permease protein